MPATRRRLSYHFGLEPDETLFRVTVNWLFELPNPDHVEMPYQMQKKTSLMREDFTQEELTVLERAGQCINDCLGRKEPMQRGPEDVFSLSNEGPGPPTQGPPTQ